MLADKHQRIHNYLRISLTDKCNLRCAYCMPEDDYAFAPNSQLMQADEIFAIAKTFTALGVTKIRLTGGEPLVRKDFASILAQLSSLPVQLALTTNATHLHLHFEALQAAGVQDINISLDSLQSDKFQLLTKRNYFEQVKNNIDVALLKGFHVKLNVVVMNGINDDEIVDFVAWTKASPIHIRFIEFMPFEGNRWQSEKVFTLQQIKETIQKQYNISALPALANDTAKPFAIEGHQGTVAVISTMSAPFCNTCNRIRLTADGKIKNCLFSSTETDILTAHRNNENIEALIKENILAKHASLGGQLLAHFEEVQPTQLINRSMISIGG